MSDTKKKNNRVIFDPFFVDDADNLLKIEDKEEHVAQLGQQVDQYLFLYEEAVSRCDGLSAVRYLWHAYLMLPISDIEAKFFSHRGLGQDMRLRVEPGRLERYARDHALNLEQVYFYQALLELSHIHGVSRPMVARIYLNFALQGEASNESSQGSQQALHDQIHLVLGIMSQIGMGQERDQKEALSYWHRIRSYIPELAYRRACVTAVSLNRTDCLWQAVEGGHPRALVELAEWLLRPHSVVDDVLMQRLSSRFTQWSLPEQLRLVAYEFYQEALALGEPMAMDVLSELGVNFCSDVVGWVSQRRSSLGVVMELGDTELTGQDVASLFHRAQCHRKDSPEWLSAMTWIAGMGHCEAHFQLGLFYHRKCDVRRMLEYLGRAADGGDARHLCEYAEKLWVFCRTDAAPYQEQHIVLWYLRALEAGSERALEHLQRLDCVAAKLALAMHVQDISALCSLANQAPAAFNDYLYVAIMRCDREAPEIIWRLLELDQTSRVGAWCCGFSWFIPRRGVVPRSVADVLNCLAGLGEDNDARRAEYFGRIENVGALPEVWFRYYSMRMGLTVTPGASMGWSLP